MTDKDMELMLQIRAQGQQALAELRKVQSGIGGIGSSAASMGQSVKNAFGMLSGLGGALFAPLKIAAKGVGILGAGLAALSIKSLMARSEMEALEIRLSAVTSSAEEAARIFKETLNLSVTSPFTPAQFIEARIGLLNLGIAGKDALMSIANAASATGRDITELVSVVASMETEPLRRLGIEVKRAAGTFEFEFRDKMGQVQKITTDGVEAARKTLLGIFDVKAGGAAEKFTKSLAGMWSTLQGNVQLGLASFAEGFEAKAKALMTMLNEQIAKLTESGQLKDWGKQFGDSLQKAWDYGRAVIEFGKDVFKSIGDSPALMATAFAEVMKAGAAIFAVTLVEYLRAMYSVFYGLGALVAGAIADILIAKFPVLGKLSDKPAELPGDILNAGIQQFWDTIPKLIAETGKVASDVLNGLQNTLVGLTGIDNVTSVQERMAGYAAARGPKMIHTEKQGGYDAEGYFWPDNVSKSSFLSGSGDDFSVGQKLPDGSKVVNITIQNASFTSDNLSQLQDQVASVADQPQTSAAGAY